MSIEKKYYREATPRTLKVVVYTCILNDYDWLVSPPFQSEGLHYVCFVNHIIKPVAGWSVKIIPSWLRLENPAHINRYIKMFPECVIEDEYDYSVYIDGRVRMIADPRILIFEATAWNPSKDLLLLQRHPDRTSVHEEFKACIEQGKLKGDDIRRITARLSEYRKMGFEDSGMLTENGVIIRSRGSEKIRRIMRVWWFEYVTYINRDQICFPFVLWKLGVTNVVVTIAPRGENIYFRLVGHRSSEFKMLSYLFSYRYNNFLILFLFRLISKLSFKLSKL